MTNPWHEHAVVYQLYVPSFRDSDGDGIGDIRGALDGLPYIRSLGVDAIWLSPCYPSPMQDGGYDVSDYRDVRPECGTLADMDEFIANCHAFGLKVLLDIVPNHTSDQHPWFQQALREITTGASESIGRDRYVVLPREGKSLKPPNNWRSLFGGPAWTLVHGPPGGRDYWYLHMFAPEQPDLNWHQPEVSAEFRDILRFWFDRGVDGFRIDVAHGLFKDPEFPNVDPQSAAARMLEATENSPYWGRSEVFGVWEDWRKVSDEYPGRMLIGEAWAPDRRTLANYIGRERLHQVFNFDGFLHRFDESGWAEPALIRTAITEWIGATADAGAPATWVLENHDVARLVTRLGGGQRGARRARASALLLLALPGAVYLYQGQDLGLPEVTLPDDVKHDPIFLRSRESGRPAVGRDGCRVPIGWSGSEPPFGFSPRGTLGRTWLPQPSYWKTLTVAAQTADPESMLSLYRNALKLRRSSPDLQSSEFVWIDAANDGVIAFRRGERFACVVNMKPTSADVRVDYEHQVLVASSADYAMSAGMLSIGSDCAVWLNKPT